MLEKHIGCVFSRASLASIDFSKEARGDDWCLVLSAIAPVKGLEVETVLMLSGP